MRAFWYILKFELGNYFKNKSFILSTILIAVIAIAAIVLPPVISGRQSEKTDTQAETVLGIVDSDSVLDLEIIETATGIQWKPYAAADELRKDVEKESIEGGFVVETPISFTYVVRNNSMSDGNQQMFEALMLQNYKTGYLMDKGLELSEVQELEQAAISSQQEILGKDSVKNYWYTYILIFVMYFLIMFYGQMIAVSVTTEKSNRAIEILVTSVDSNSLIFGKVLAGAIAGILQVVIILGAAFGTYGIFREAWNYQLDFLFHVPGIVWGIYGIFGVLGYLLYAFIYGALGALVSKTEDISKSVNIITFLYIGVFLLSVIGLNDPDGLMMKIASFVPLTSSNAMLIRAAMGNLALWEILISLVILVLSSIGVGIVAAKLFRFGTLMYGNPIKLTHALKKMRQ